MDSWATSEHANFPQKNPSRKSSPLNIYLQNVTKRNEYSHLTSSHTYMFCFLFGNQTYHVFQQKWTTQTSHLTSLTNLIFGNGNQHLLHITNFLPKEMENIQTTPQPIEKFWRGAFCWSYLKHLWSGGDLGKFRNNFWRCFGQKPPFFFFDNVKASKCYKVGPGSSYIWGYNPYKWPKING